MLTSNLNRHSPFHNGKFKNSPITIMLMLWMYKLYISPIGAALTLMKGLFLQGSRF